MVLVQGANGQGKSNLLEAIYILAVAKSHRASTERQLIRRQSITNESFAQIAGSINREGDTTKLQVDFSWMTSPSSEYHDLRVKKYVHINGIRRRGSELVGEMNAVLFTADDLNLVYGSPTIRRRYLDILISQTDREYLKTLQRYQRIVTNRNHLLKEIRDRRSKESELTIWDDQLADAGALILTRRANTLARLSDTATQTHKDLSNVGLTLNEEDALKAQIFGCWSIPLGLPYDNLLVRIKLQLKQDGTVVKTEILDHARMNKPGQGFYKVLAESALRAIQLCQPLRVPTTGYEKWKDLQLNFDANEMLKG